MGFANAPQNVCSDDFVWDQLQNWPKPLAAGPKSRKSENYDSGLTAAL